LVSATEGRGGTPRRPEDKQAPQKKKKENEFANSMEGVGGGGRMRTHFFEDVNFVFDGPIFVANIGSLAHEG